MKTVIIVVIIAITAITANAWPHGGSHSHSGGGGITGHYRPWHYHGR